MMNCKKYIDLFLTVVIYIMTSSLYSQKSKLNDSIIKTCSIEMYANPDKVILEGKKIVANSDNIDYKIKGYKLIADGYSSKRDYQKSLEYVIKANKLLNLSSNKLLKIIILNKLGIQYHQLKIFDKSIQYLDQAEDLILKYPYPDSIHADLGKNFIVRGFIYKDKFSCDIAIDFFNRGIAELLKAKNNSNYAIISIAKYNKGNCYIILSNNKLAKENFIQSIEAAKIINGKSLWAFGLKGLAEVYTIEGNYKEAISSLKLALVLSQDVNDLILNDELYFALSENYLAINEWDEFKKYHEKEINVQKLLKSRQRISVSESLGVKEVELKSKIEIETSNFYYIILFLAVLFVLILLFFSLYFRRKTKEIDTINNKIHLLQNDKIK
ncbi:tetratricopeptide repeat protein [Flavobacterium sp.]|uniref:tetratricopeptide repeat protein n=1 Tax=Flavobacterium sp. TaxID=239 RepID=UPI003BBAF19E